jgi:nitrite reductase/ring-hydroxylating ferredoxin subunit
MQEFFAHKIADALEQIPFAENDIALVTVNGRELCIVRRNNQLYACAAKCPHAGGMLTEGYVDALGNIVCPVHHYRFNLETGRDTGGEGYFLKKYQIEQSPDGIYIKIP